jgi:hypothetical protein
MRRGGGVKLPEAVVLLGPRTKRSVTALTQGKPVVAEKGLPGPELPL